MMRVHVKREALREALALVSKAVASRSTVPVLYNVRIAAEVDSLLLQATDLEIGMTVKIGGALVEQAGATTLPAKLLNDWVAGLAGDEVEMHLQERTETVTLVCGDAKAQVKGIPASDFPLISRPVDGGEWQRLVLPARDLGALVARVAYAAARDKSRPTLTGVNVMVSKDELKLAATDGYRLAVAVQALDHASAVPPSFIVPAHSLRLIGQICAGAGATAVEICVAVPAADEASGLSDGVQRVVWRGSSGDGGGGLDLIEVCTYTIAGRYPDYQAIIPKTQTTQMTLDAGALVAGREHGCGADNLAAASSGRRLMTSADRLFAYIIAFKHEHDGNSPTRREIVAAGLASSTSHADYTLHTLARQGRIRLGGPGAARAIHVVGSAWLPPE